MKTSSAVRASLVIPTLNRSELLIDTVGYLLDQISDRDEIIIVDQTDQPGPAVLQMATWDPRINYHHIIQKGLPNARNVGALHAKGEIIIFCDDDVIPQNQFIKAHVAAYADPAIGAVAGRVILPDREAAHSPHFGSLRQWDFRIIGKFHSLEKKFVAHGQGCNFSVRAALYREGITNDINFGGSAHLEETDLFLQINGLGYKILYEPEAALVHLISQTGGCRAPDLEVWLYWYGHNYMLLFLKHGLRRYFPTFLLARTAKLVVTALQDRKLRYLTSGFKGLWDGVNTYFQATGKSSQLQIGGKDK